MTCLVSLALTACGFTPIYKINGDAGGAVRLAALAVPESENGRALATALRGRWVKDAAAGYELRLTIDETARDTQLDAQGIGAREEVSFVVRGALRGPDGRSKLFTLSEQASMAKTQSGADDLTQRRNLARLAMQSLADQLLLRLSREGLSQKSPAGEAAGKE